MKNDLENLFRENHFSFSKGFSDRVMNRLEKENIKESYSHAFKQMSWWSAAAIILLFVGAYMMGDNYVLETPYENWDEYFLYND